ncbi:phosphodiesterase [Thermoleophilia bacterium SCSIO 60948]|nr:phosphodiesterase [Thermoleophilia bacterium SCSIO 60948]
MSAPTVIAQISDPHIRIGRGDKQAAAALAAAVRKIVELGTPPDAVLVSGDLSEDGSPRTYERVRELLGPLEHPVFVMAGNHDDREALREYFMLPGGSTGGVGEPFRYTAQIGGLRLVACDSTIPGRGEGSLSGEHRAWIDFQLAADPVTPVLLAMHHPPFDVGIRRLDVDYGMPATDRAALADLLARNPQVLRVTSGHVHRVCAGTLGGCTAVTAASTDRQMPLAFGDFPLIGVDEPPSLLLHALLEPNGEPAPPAMVTQSVGI